MRTFIIVLIFLLPNLLLANFWAKHDIKIVEIVEAGYEEGRVEVLKDGQERIFEVGYFGKLDEKAAEKILELNTRIYGLGSLKINRIRYEIWEDSINISVNTAQIQFQGRDLGAFFPGGLAFFYLDGALRYELRMVKDGVSQKIKGIFETEELLYKDVLKYVSGQKMDQEIIERKLEIQGEEIPDRPKTIAETLARPSLRVFFGSGGLISFGYALIWDTFEIMPTLSYVRYLPDDEITEPIIGIPLGVRFHYYLTGSAYAFGGAFYALGLENYEDSFVLQIGAGLIMLDYFFGELGYTVNKERNGMIMGLGLKFPF